MIFLGEANFADSLKKKLQAFTPSGTFNNGRKAEIIGTYSGFIVLDIDKLSDDQLYNAKNAVQNCQHTYSVFISPSGNGLKVIVPVNSMVTQHKHAYQQVSDYYESLTNLQIDQSGKDVSRLCFMSYDPECYINTNAVPFQFNADIKQINQLPVIKFKNTNMLNTVSNNNDEQQIFQNCKVFTEKKQTYAEGNRNNFIHLLACNCNRAGLSHELTEKFTLQSFDLNQQETISTIASAYINNQNEFGNVENFANVATLVNETKAQFSINIDEAMEDSRNDTPYLPDEIFDQLPSILKDGCKVFSNPRERDVFLSSALPILGGCMPNVISLYSGKEYFANLYTFIIAAAASGKGSLYWAKVLGSKYHKILLDDSNTKKKEYEQKMEIYKNLQFNNKGKSSEMELPQEPNYKILYIPANISSARVIQHLKEGNERGIFCETEADSMGNTLKQDWGGYSDLLRKAFHHEPISYSRKTNKEFVEIDNPCLSVALSGTPGQVENLIKSSEDGLFSRFIFYSFNSSQN